MRVAYVGNFSAPWCTEVEIHKALEALGVDVVQFQENYPDTYDAVPVNACDVILWTRTPWDWPGLGISYDEIYRRQRAMLDRAAAAHTPTIGYTLDRWWGLSRQGDIGQPFFQCSVVYTADGGHDQQWKDAGVNHVWLPPGVSEFECHGGKVRPEFDVDIAFVGSWWGAYHREWTHRQELIEHLRKDFPGRSVGLFPSPGDFVRNDTLRDLYASTRVNVGDSCLMGTGHYWSDRIPETLGRGGFLLHPYVEGIEEHFTDGEHLVLWKLGDWAELYGLVERYLEDPDARRAIAAAGRQHVLDTATYTVRMKTVLDAL